MKKFIYTLMLVFVLASCQSGVNEQVNEDKYFIPDAHFVNGKIYVDSLRVIGDSTRYGIRWIDINFYQDGKEVYRDMIPVEPVLDWEYDSKTNSLVQVEPEYKVADFVGYLNRYPAGFYEVKLIYLNDTLEELCSKKHWERICVDATGEVH